jgi:hypothetical protein
MQAAEEHPENAPETCDKCSHIADVAVYKGRKGVPARLCGCCLAPVWRVISSKKRLIVVPLDYGGMVAVHRRLVVTVENMFPDDLVDRIRREVQAGGA